MGTQSPAVASEPHKETTMSDMVPPGVRLGIVRGISYGLFGKPDQFVPPAPRAGRDAGARVLLLVAGRARARPVHLRGRRRVPRPARRLRGGLGHRLLQLTVGDPAGDRLPAALAGQGPRRLPPVRGPPGAPLRRAGAVLAVRQRALQRRTDLGRAPRPSTSPSSRCCTGPSRTPTPARRWSSAARPTRCRPALPAAPSGSSSTCCCATAATSSTCSTCTCTGTPAGSRPTSRPLAR